MRRSALFVAPVLFALALFYRAVFRPWQLRWGARDEEVERSMPGDEIIGKPSFDATRAVSINARPRHIYPWIVQMGVTPRAGWYSYDLLDNLGRKSAETILPEYQHVQIGDLVPISPDGKQGLWVKDFVENEWTLWWDKVGDTSWAWAIYPDGEGSRLVTRIRTRYRWLSPAALFNLIVEFFDIVMMRKCMLGIKRRAEALARSQPSAA